MILLLFSDNHRNKENIDIILKRHPNADRIISLGDSEMSEAELTGLGIFGVRGNYPFEPKFPDDLLFVFDEWMMVFTHGHRQNVKSGLTQIYLFGKEKVADAVFFGHTHRAFLEDFRDLVLCNPGSLAQPRINEPASYAVVKTSLTDMLVDILKVEDGCVLRSIVKHRRIKR